jgi:hypothetical protein
LRGGAGGILFPPSDWVVGVDLIAGVGAVDTVVFPGRGRAVGFGLETGLGF